MPTKQNKHSGQAKPVTPLLQEGLHLAQLMCNSTVGALPINQIGCVGMSIYIYTEPQNNELMQNVNNFESALVWDWWKLHLCEKILWLHKQLRENIEKLHQCKMKPRLQMLSRHVCESWSSPTRPLDHSTLKRSAPSGKLAGLTNHIVMNCNTFSQMYKNTIQEQNLFRCVLIQTCCALQPSLKCNYNLT